MTLKDFISTLSEEDYSYFRVFINNIYEGEFHRASFAMEYIKNLIIEEWVYEPSDEVYYVYLKQK